MLSFLINMLPSSIIQGKSPIEVLLKKSLDLSHLRVFGCACYPNLRPYNSHKFEFHSEICVYLGLSPVHKGSQCLLSTGKIIISRHVTFNENLFPFQEGFGSFIAYQLDSTCPSIT